jgi:hypothetical protein
LKGLKNKIECIEKDNLELNCLITPVYPQPEFNWYKDERLLEMSNVKIINENNVSKLLIESIDLSFDLSKLKFIASNELGSCETETTIEVYVSPRFIFPLKDAQPQLNKPFEWNFEIDSHPEPKLKFFKNEKDLNLSKESRIRLNKELNTESDRKIYKFKLNFVNIQADDFGSYKIEAQNKYGVSASQANLTVIGSPCFTKKPLDTNILVGKPLKIDFEIAGIPNPDIEIFKNDVILVLDNHIYIESKNKSNYVLNIKTAAIDDAGNYKVCLKNDIGYAEESFTILIFGNFLKFL